MKLKLVTKKDLDEGAISFYFQPESSISWKAGQYLRYHIDNSWTDDRGENRFFSIASAPFENQIQLTTRFAIEKCSAFKKDLQNLEIGGEIEVFGPSGSFTVDDPLQQFVFIAGGIGITPFRSIILDLNHQNLPINVTLFYANRTPEVLFKEELERISSNHPEFTVHYFIGETLVDATAIKQLVPDVTKPLFYISGPEPMVKGLEKTLIELGADDEKVKRDYFPGYTLI